MRHDDPLVRLLDRLGADRVSDNTMIVIAGLAALATILMAATM